MVLNATRRVYSAEELHRLRNTTSQPKLHEAIEEHDGDDAELVKEHVLRGSKSFAARSWKSRTSASTSLRVPSNKENRSTNASDNDRPNAPLAAKVIPVLGEIAANNQIPRPGGPFKARPSPTHSLRRKKIDSLVKAHGSPDHVRVTAGGRIVPSEQSPLCHPRYGYSAIKSNGGLIKFAPNHPMGKAQWTQATQNGFVAQDVNGRLCQIVDGTILPLHETEDGLQLYIPAPNLNITQRPSSIGNRPNVPNRFAANGNSQPPTRILSEPPISSQINALEIEYAKLEHELKDVDKTEVLHGRTMGKGAKDALVAKRRELIVHLDKIRRALKSLREQAPANAPTSPRANMYKQQSMSPPRSRLPAFLQQRQQNQQMVLPPAPPAPVFGPFFGAAQSAPYAGPYGFQSTPSPDSGFGGQPWALPPPAMFVPPSAFDGSISSASLPFQPEPFAPAAPIDGLGLPVPPQEPSHPLSQAAVDAVPAETHLPQNDGSRSIADVPRVASPLLSRALSIKAPEHKAIVKSTLNPMSPVYKPGAGLLQPEPDSDRPAVKSVKDRAPTPLSPLQQLRANASSLKATTTKTDGAADSPTKNSRKIHSSSVSSFQTADFFPHNTRDFSTRKYASSPQSTADIKENVGPVTPAKDMVLTHAHPTPVAPPATPVDGLGLPDRSMHNLSPKNKWLSPSIDDQHIDQGMTPEIHEPIDAAGKSREWLAGYNAALASQQSRISDRSTSRLPSPCLSTTSLGSSRPGRIFSGLFSQLDGGPQTSLNTTVCGDNTARTASSPTDNPDVNKSTKASPARAKFERIAESVGIKVDNLSPTKRRWRDVWRSSRN